MRYTAICLLALVVAAASACSNTPTKPEQPNPTTNQKGISAATWSPEYFPMNEGDHWIYEYSYPKQKRKTLRVKNVLKTPRGLRLDDADGECYYFESDAKGWRINGETVLGDDDHSHYFKPAMVYASPELLEKGRLTGEHSVEEDGIVRAGKIKSEATLVGFEEVELPRLGKHKALHTTFAYMSNAESRFQIHNWCVKGLGAVKRTLRMNRGGKEIFSVEVKLIAARINGKIFPQGDEAFFAKTVFDEARKHRKVMTAGFKGLSSDVKVTHSEFGTVEGNLTVGFGAKAQFTPKSQADKALVERVQAIMSSRIAHRLRTSAEATSADTKFELLDRGYKNSVAVKNLSDRGMGSNYEVIGNRLRTVRRDMGPGGMLHLETAKVQWIRKKYIPIEYWWEMSNKEGKKTRTTARDTYKRVGKWLLPTTTSETTGKEVITIELINPTLRGQ